MPDFNTLKEIREKLWPDFSAFFADKYDGPTLEAIFDDLINFLSEDHVEKIYFCYYDSVADVVTNGYCYELTSGTATRPVREEVSPIEQISPLRTDSEKFLVLKMNESFMDKNRADKDAFFSELKLQWDNMMDPKIINQSIEEKLVCEHDTQVKRCAIKG